MSKAPALKGYLLIVLLACCWGSFWPVMQLAVREMPVIPFRIITGLGAGIFILTVALARRQSLRVPRALWRPLLITSLFTTTFWLLFSALGASILGSGRAVLLTYTMPLWAFLFGIWLLGEKPRPVRWLGLAIALGGIAVMALADPAAFFHNPLGALAMLAAAISLALGSVLLKKQDWQMSNVALAGWQTTLGSLPMVFLAWIQPFDITAISATAWLATVYVAVIGIAAGTITYFTVLRLLPLSTATLGVLMVPAIGLGLSALFGERNLGWPEFTALACIIIAMAAVMPIPHQFRNLFRGRNI